MKIENNTGKTGLLKLYIDENGSKIFVRGSKDYGCFTLKNLAEFIFQIDCNGASFTVSEQNCAGQSAQRENKIYKTYHHSFFEVEVVYAAEDDVFRKRMRFTAKKALRIRYAKTELCKCDAPLRRGGEGQPILINEMAFMGIEFPASVNRITNDTILLEQSPFIDLAEGETYEFYPIVYGIGSSKSIEADFIDYIRKNRVTTKKGLKIYGDWAAHDELSDSDPLDEAMALRLLHSLNDAKEKYNVSFDTYLMDAFWYEEKQPYTAFKKNTWPNGIQPFLVSLEKSGMDLGLWFDVNMEKLELNGYTKRQEGDYKLCLADPKVSDALFDGIEQQMRECRLTSIKLDFAYFECENKEHTYHSALKTESKEPAVRNFLHGIERLKKINPNLLILAYNGFTTDLKYLAYVDEKLCKYTVSPWWLFYLNYIYCGDPRPSEVPTRNLSNSIIYYTDAMIAQFAKSLIPFEGIDDHGTMIGKTGTIYNLKTEGFYDSWIMNISRGGQKLHLYGETDYLTEQHWKFIRDSREMFDFTCRPDNITTQILGVPNMERPYGYSNSNGYEGYITLVNCCNMEKIVSVSLEEWKFADNLEWEKIYAGDQMISGEKTIFAKSCTAVLPANSVTVYRWKYRMTEKQWEGVSLLCSGSEEKMIIPADADSVTFCFYRENGLPLRTHKGIPEGFEIQFQNATAELICKEFIWSGISWAKYQVTPDGTDEIPILLKNRTEINVTVKWQVGLKGVSKNLEKSI